MTITFRRAVVLALSTVLSVGSLTVAATSGVAAAPNHDRVVSAVPPSWTPSIDDGSVQNVAQTGNVMVAVGDFTSVTPQGGVKVARQGAVAFDASNGALVSSFAPTFNGAVNDVIPGPTSGTVYVAGGFTKINNVTANRVALLDARTGALVSTFKTPGIGGVVNAIVRSGNRLYVGGNFSMVSNQAHNGLVAVNASTGALDASVGNQFMGHHNDSGSGAQGAVGIRDLDVTPDGSRLVVIGNFKTVDGLTRDQIALLDVSGATAVVRSDWRTRRYEPYCFSWAFDTYVRGVSFSPDGSFFVVATTGGPNAGTLCDTASRFETNGTGDDVQPTWTDYTGGDTLWGVTVTEEAVYVGGHQRWLNNSSGADSPGQGAVPRPGLAALDLDTGLPIAWNPGRNPRGVAVYALYATSAGLWMGSNTEWVGNFQYKRPRLAYFPIADGSPPASDAIAGLPGTAYLGGASSTSQGNILYRVDAGGPTIGSVDAGPDWISDDQASSPYRNDGSNAAAYAPSVSMDSTVPSSTPSGVFDTERWSPSDDPAMSWSFPVKAGTAIEVRLYFANRYSGTSSPGSRVFDVALDGTRVLDHFDIVATTGDQRGTMKAFDITSDGAVDIDFSHEVENPLVNAIEIVRTDQAPPTASSSLKSIGLSSTGPSGVAQDVPDQGVDWTSVRGAFVAGGKLWYGVRSGEFKSRTITSGGVLGPETTVDPYNDPAWAGVSTGSGGTYDGRPTALYGQMSSVTGMAYADGRLYYTLAGDSNLYWRWFNTDSGIIGSEYFAANGGRSWSGTSGMFVADGELYYASADGNLNKISLTAGVPTGNPTLVDGPAQSGTDWRARALYLSAAAAPAPNTDPTASFTSSCDQLVCSFDASASSDVDGTIASYAWDFGPGSGTGKTTEHTFAADGTYSVKLTVTDDRGGSATLTKQLTVSTTPAPKVDIAFRDSSGAAANLQDPTIDIPAGTQAGDLLLFTATVSSSPTVSDPTGWTLVGRKENTGMTTLVWSRTATSSDAGKTVSLHFQDRRKSALAISAYQNAGQVGATATATDSRTDTHKAPALAVTSGSWIVWYFADKSGSTGDWTGPSGAPVRAEVLSSGSGRWSAFVLDSDGPLTGNVEGVTATTDVQSAYGISWAIELQPAP
ncbi:PKD domain-containing protein [Nostocoides sp. Soil756]|jgi:hypothetical protein|uniref:PKD domain-containing protein n=1 Tax=Nostocoides sp. Soil756 TaxID=1736399 RepID=UPI0006F72FC3|nr:PKD domain-containing protein [Tetrasphaera sp. Soil756]KRE62034.1 hypothetical protein ASG78_02905 [Tetrasphaera sp. Soil756]